MVTSGHVTKMAVTIWSAVSETPYATYANFTFLSSTEPELGLLQIEVFHLHVYIKVPNGDSWPVSVCRTAGMPIMAHCQPYADHLDLALRPHFLSSTFAGSAIMLAICFRLPLTERRRSDCLLFTLLLHHHRCFSDRRTVKWCTLAIYHTNRLSRYRYLQDGAVLHDQPITLDMDLVRGHCNGTWYVVRQISRRYIEAELACSQQSRLSAVHSADTAVAYVFTHRCTWRRRDAQVRKTFKLSMLRKDFLSWLEWIYSSV